MIVKKKAKAPLEIKMTKALDFQLRSSPPTLESLSKNLVLSRTANNQYRTLRVKGEENAPLMGLEYEGYFSPTTIQQREIDKFLTARGSVLPSDSNFYGGTSRLLTRIRDNVFNNLSELIKDRPHFDGGGLESVFYPASLGAYNLIKDEIVYILNVYKAFGFTDNIPGAGIHVNVDFSMFGADAAEQRRTLANFLWFAFINNDFIVELSQRKYSDTFRVDMWHQLGDVLAANYNNTVRNFIQTKNRMLDAVEEGSTLRSFNLHAHRDGRPALEIRWFGSTQNPDRLMMMVEFTHAIIRFCKEAQDNQHMLSLHLFSASVRKHAAIYPHLYEYMDENPYSQEYMRIASSVEQTAQRNPVTVNTIQ